MPSKQIAAHVTVRAIRRKDLDRIVLRCWPDRAAIDRLFADQGAVGMAAWEGEECVGQLHCYRVMLPDGVNPDWPQSWWSGEKAWTEWRGWGPGMKGLPAGPAWFHACCHVGRLLESQAISDDPDPRYFGRGIGTALCKASVQWAREHDYAVVLAPGAPDGLFEFATWAGHLPWTRYAKLGFDPIDAGGGDDLPNWAQGDSPPEVMDAVNAALAAGRPKSEIRERLMVLDLKKNWWR